MTTIIEMRVHMDCAGCESKVKSSLQKLKGVDDVEIDLSMQKVTVRGWADQKKVLRKVRKTGRRAELWQLPDHHQLSGGHPVGATSNLSYYAPQPSSSYNYYKHGYDDTYSNNYAAALHPSILNNHHSYAAASKFSDENPHACSIM